MARASCRSRESVRVTFVAALLARNFLTIIHCQFQPKAVQRTDGMSWFMVFLPCSMTAIPTPPTVVIGHATHWPRPLIRLLGPIALLGAIGFPKIKWRSRPKRRCAPLGEDRRLPDPEPQSN